MLGEGFVASGFHPWCCSQKLADCIRDALEKRTGHGFRWVPLPLCLPWVLPAVPEKASGSEAESNGSAIVCSVWSTNHARTELHTLWLRCPNRTGARFWWSISAQEWFLLFFFSERRESQPDYFRLWHMTGVRLGVDAFLEGSVVIYMLKCLNPSPSSTSFAALTNQRFLDFPRFGACLGREALKERHPLAAGNFFEPQLLGWWKKTPVDWQVLTRQLTGIERSHNTRVHVCAFVLSIFARTLFASVTKASFQQVFASSADWQHACDSEGFAFPLVRCDYFVGGRKDLQKTKHRSALQSTRTKKWTMSWQHQNHSLVISEQWSKRKSHNRSRNETLDNHRMRATRSYMQLWRVARIRSRWWQFVETVLWMFHRGIVVEFHVISFVYAYIVRPEMTTPD